MTSAGQSYEGAAFHEGLEGGREPGRIELGTTSVRFAGETATVDLPLHGLSVRLGGASDRLVFFSHPSAEGWSVYTSDRAILDHPTLWSVKEIASQLRSIRGQRRSSWLSAALVLAGIGGAAAGLLRLKDPLVAALARRVPASVEKKLGDAAFAQISFSGKPVSDEQIVGPIRAILGRLEPAAGSGRTRFQLYVFDDPALNAFALPGGHIVLHTGLILAASRPEQIAGVIAHEMAHVTRQHSMRQMLSALGLFALVQALLGDVSGLAAVLADSGTTLLTMSFSRDFEREADDSGLLYLQNASIDPRGMLEFFKQLQNQETRTGSAAAGALEFLSTHPTTSERIDRLERKIAGRQGKFSSIPVDLTAVKKRIREREAQDAK